VAANAAKAREVAANEAKAWELTVGEAKVREVESMTDRDCYNVATPILFSFRFLTHPSRDRLSDHNPKP
jgi:hypothetical protein